MIRPRRPACIRPTGPDYRVAFVVVLLVAAGVPSLVPAGSAQGVPGSFSLESLAMERSPVVAQGDNTIQGEILNDGNVPVQVWAYIEAEYGETWDSDVKTTTIQPGDRQTVPWAWDGPSVDTTADEVGFTMHAWRQVGDTTSDEKSISITRAVQRNDFRLDPVSGPPATVAPGETATIAQVRVTNTGNVDDTAVLSFRGGSGWDLVAVPSEIPVPFGESRTISVVGRAPQAPSSSTSFTLVAETSEPRADEGENDPERDALAGLTPGVVAGTDLIVAMTPPLLARGPGDVGTYRISVHNPTDTEVEEVHFKIPSASNPSIHGVSLSMDNLPGVDLAPGESVDFTLGATIGSPALATQGTPVSWPVEIRTKQTDGTFVVRNSQDLSLTVNQTHAVRATVNATQMPPAFSPDRGSEALPGDPDVGLPLHEAPGSRSITWVGGCGSPACLFVDMDDDRVVSVGDIVLAVAGEGDVQPGGTMDNGDAGIGVSAAAGAFLPAFIDEDGSGDLSQGDIIVLDDPTQDSGRGELGSGDVYLSGPLAGTVETQDNMGPLASLPADVFGFCYFDRDGDGLFQRTEPVYFSASCTAVEPRDVPFSNLLSLPHRRSAVPSQTITIPLTVTNLGNGVDTICIQARLPADWTGGTSCLDVAPAVATAGPTPWNNTVSFDWDVDLAPWAAAGDQMVTFFARSEDPAVPSGTVRPVGFTVPSRTHPQLAPTLPPVLPSLQAQPCVFAMHGGEDFTLSLALRNDGNTAGTFGLSSQDVDAGWIVAAPTSQQYSLDRLGSRLVQVPVRAPQAFEPGESSTFTLVLTDVGSSQTDTLECVVHASFPDLVVAEEDPLTTPPDLYADHPATLRFRVANVGWNATGTPVLVSTVVEGPDGESKQNHTLPALDRWTGDWWQELEVNFTPSMAGEYTYSVVVDPDDAIQEPDEEDNVVNGTLQVIDFGVAVTAPPGREAIPTQHLTFEGKLGDNPAFKVVNNGDRTHTLNLSLAMDPAWRPVSYQEVTLGPTQEHWVDVNFTIPATPLVGEVRVTLRAANATVPTLGVEQTTRIRIHDTGAPTVSGFTANATAVLSGGNVSFQVDLHDTTGIAEARLIAIGPNGTRSQAMAGDAPVGTFSANLTFDALGVHTVYVWAMDDVGNVVDNADDGTALEVRVLPTDRPHVQLIAPGNGTSIRPGTPVVLSVLSHLAVAHVEYATPGADPITVTATNPIHVATGDWSEGGTDLHVLVRDAAGAEGRGNFSFLVDGTAPKILAIALDPEGGLPGTEVGVTATIQDTSQMASVVLRIERADGRAQDLGMDAGDEGTWSTDVELPEDAVRIAVAATDEAGNRAYAERSLADPQLHDGDPGSRFTPAPLPVLALLALACAFRRSRSKW